MKSLLFLLILLLPYSNYSQTICKIFDYQKAIKPYLNNSSKFDSVLKSYGEINGSLTTKEGYLNNSVWRVCPIIRISINKDLGYFFDTVFRVVIIDKKQHLVYGYELNQPDFVTRERNIPFIEDQLEDNNKSYFFLPFLLDNESNSYDIIGYFKEGCIIFRTTKSVSPFSLEGLIKYRYGSIEKYKELCNDQEKVKSIKNQFQPNTLAGAIKLLTNDWSLRSKYIPNDSIGNIDLLIQQISNSTMLEIEQKSLLKIKILNFFTFFRDNKIFADIWLPNSDFLVYNFDLHDIISDVLTKNQFQECESYFKALKKNLLIAENFIFSNVLDSQLLNPDINRNSKAYEEKMKIIFK